MKTISMAFLLIIITPIFSNSAVLLKNVDGIEFDCTAYSYDSGEYYYVSVIFYGDEATITFDHGGYISLTMDDERIEDPGSISAYDYDKGVYWELAVSGMD